jgi:hypothetical protein
MVLLRTRVTAYAGILSSVAATALVLAPHWHPANFAGALLLACIPAGAAVMCWIDSGEGVAQASLTLVVSLALFTIASALMIWLDIWHPRALIGLAAVSAFSCLASLLRRTDA